MLNELSIFREISYRTCLLDIWSVSFSNSIQFLFKSQVVQSCLKQLLLLEQRAIKVFVSDGLSLDFKLHFDDSTRRVIYPLRAFLRSID